MPFSNVFREWVVTHIIVVINLPLFNAESQKTQSNEDALVDLTGEVEAKDRSVFSCQNNLTTKTLNKKH